MENEEIEVARPFCYGCHERVDGDLNVMASRRFVFPFHKDCFYKCLVEFRRKAPVIQSEARGGLE